MIVAAALAALAGLAAVVVWRPQWLINGATAGWALRTFGAEYAPRWRALDVRVRAAGPRERELVLRAEDACVQAADGSFSACADRLAARVVLSFSRREVRVVEAGPLVVEGARVRADRRSAAPPPPGPAEPRRTAGALAAPLRGMVLRPVLIRLKELDLLDRDGETRASGTLSLAPGRARPARVEARWTRLRDGKASSGYARVAAATDALAGRPPTWVEARGDVEAAGAAASFRLAARRTGPTTLFARASADARAAGARLRLSARGPLSEDLASLAGDARVDLTTGPVRWVSLSSFTATATRGAGSWAPDRLQLEGRWRVARSPDAAALARLPAELSGLLTAGLRLTPRPDAPDAFAGEIGLTSDPVKAWYEARGALTLAVDGRLGDPRSARARPAIRVSARVPKFSDVVALLSGTPFAVPAPLDVLEGPLDAEAEATGDPVRGDADVSFKASSGLAAGRQRLRARLSGRASARGFRGAAPALSVAAVARLDDVALQLPHLDALRMPALAPDSRIKTPEAPKPAAAAAPKAGPAAPPLLSSATLSLDLRVVASTPVVLYTDLAQSPVPVSLDVRARRPPGALGGAVGVRSFGVEFFRRRAQIDHVSFALDPAARSPGIDGLVLYRAPEALVRIRLLGTAERPRVVLESDPPMSENDILALLLFGKPPDELDADQTSTVANTETAFADKAFGLASLFLFASTPIQYVGYDPMTKAYTMRFTIPGGETLAVSSAETSKSVSLRKRLGAHWQISTEARQTQEEGGVVTTFLEWFTRR